MRYIKQKKIFIENLTILQDDREKAPWLFLRDIWKVEKKRLKVGDYTIKDFEDKIAIEKKSGIKELLTNLSAPNRETFKQFLEKLSTYQIKCIIVEEPLNSTQIDSVLRFLGKRSKNRVKLTAETIFFWTARIVIEYNIPMIYADKRSVREILPNVIKKAYQKALEK